MPRTDIEILSGEDYRTFTRFDWISGEIQMVGRIHPLQPLNNFYNRPIMDHFRPTSGINLEHLKVAKREVPVDGEKCVVLEDPDIGAKRRREYYIRPDREFAIQRCVQYFKEHLESQLDTDFQRDKVEGWVPTSISGASYLREKVLNHSSKSTVTKFESNTPIAREAFTVDFPEGTQVRDIRATSKATRRQTP